MADRKKAVVENNGGQRTREGKSRLGGVTGRGFNPGQSGNPGGRPAGMAEVAALARQRTKEAIGALVYWANRRKDPRTARASVAAAEILLDRGWGRPTQPVEMTQTINLEILSSLTDAELDALEAVLNRIEGRVPPPAPAEPGARHPGPQTTH